ncbi:MAG TPA: copper homeostasis protein CutC [Acidobacteriaceae bacterium]|jgi:copper homeostasis protein|nr:copper homeostasis protein CutC [Acidobacteriaceae bacterium]
MPLGRTLEICVDSLELAQAAVLGGADRIELCGHLHDGGISPSAGLTQAVRNSIQVPLAVLVRSRTGAFTASDEEFEVMRQDILIARKTGVDIVVLGILHADRTVDIERTRQLVELARPMQVTFHRAFDVCPNLEVALDAVLATGADRILTSGASSSAIAGAPTVNKLRKVADGRVTLMLCGSISPATIRRALHLSGVQEAHASLRSSTRAKAAIGAAHVAYREQFIGRVRELKRLMHQPLKTEVHL